MCNLRISHASVPSEPRRRCLFVLGIQLRNVNKFRIFLQNRLQRCFKRRNSTKKIKTVSPVFILNATFVEHIHSSNVTFHILFNEIFDVANIICMKIVVDIRCHAHAQLQGDISLHVIVNLIKFKRMHGLNYLSFGEQRLLFL